MSRYAAVNVRFGADISQFSTAMQNAARQMQRAGQQLQDVGKSMTMNLTAPILALGAASLYAFGEIDALKRGLISFTGSAELAENEFNKLREVAKLPGIGLEEATRGSINLQAIGMSADDARKAMQAFGNAIATVGGGKENFDLAIRGFGQLTNASKPLQQDLYQIANQLPQVNKLMIEAFGTNRAEDLAAMGISGKQLAEFLVNSLSKLPPITGGIKNSFENMSDTIKISLSGIGEAIDKNFNISGKLNAFADWIGDLSDKFKSLDPNLQKFIIGALGIAAAIGPVFLALGALVKIFPAVLAGMVAFKTAVGILAGPIGILSIGIAALTVLLVNYATATNAVEDAQTDFAKILSTSTGQIDVQKTKLDELYKKLQDTNISQKERNSLITQFNAISGANLKNISDETTFQNNLAAAYKKTNEQMQAKKYNALEAAKLQKEADLLALQSEIKIAQEAADRYKKENIIKVGPLEFTTTPISDLFGTPIDDLAELEKKAEAARLTIQSLSRELYKISPSGNVAPIETQIKAPFIPKVDKKQSEAASKASFDIIEMQTKGITQSFSKLATETQLGWENANAANDLGSQKYLKTYQDKFNAISDIINQGAANMAIGLAAAFGENLVDGDPFKDLGNILLSSLGNVMVQLGSEMVVFGGFLQAFKAALASLNPVVAVAAGLGMIAAGAAISKIAAKGMQSPTSGGGGGSYGGSSSGGNFTLETRLEGNDLGLSGQRTRYTRGR